jgi:hypothetical protein
MRLLTRGYGLAVLAATNWQSTFARMACLKLRLPKVNGRKEFRHYVSDCYRRLWWLVQLQQSI